MFADCGGGNSGFGAVAFEGYAFAQQGSQPQATCLCSDGTRVVAQGPAASATLALREVNGGLTAAAGCYADGMRWSLAAPFVGACRSGIAAGTCIPECADALLPFNLECFQSVLRQPFFAYAPGVELPSKEQLAAVYAACFPPSATAPAPAPAPALEQAASGAAVGGAAAPGQDATWLQGAES
ncbi:hypothetical protein ABPG75_012445 [Micractinium tetrahymenae]